jgi:hypothetical protein
MRKTGWNFSLHARFAEEALGQVRPVLPAHVTNAPLDFEVQNYSFE